MDPRRSFWMLAAVALLAVGGLLGVHVYRLETRLAALEAGSVAPAREASPSREGRAPPATVRAVRRNVRLDAGAAQQVAKRLGDELGIDTGKVDRLARFLMAFHLRTALDKARARGEDLSEAAANHPELLRVDLKQELLGLQLSQAQLATLSRKTPGVEALLAP